ncbi:helix-turn-helix domain-containing protein [Acinetobacter soli]
MSTKVQRDITHKLKVLAHIEQNGNIELTSRYFGISRDTFYRWKKNI